MSTFKVSHLALPAIALGLPLAAQGDDSMRCGTGLVSTGDRTFQVMEKCGEPAYRDQIGYTAGYYNNRELKLEEWVYGPTNGMLYILSFEGNRLIGIETRRNR